MGSHVVVAVGEASKSFRGMLKLNSTAADVWLGIDRGLSKSEICDFLMEKYEIDRETLEKDVDNSIKSLIEQGFVE
jgi:hypothetical protein